MLDHEWRHGQLMSDEELEDLYQRSRQPDDECDDGHVNGAITAAMIVSCAFGLAAVGVLGWVLYKFVGWAVAAVQ